MAESKKQDLFTSKVKPIMDKVRDDLNSKKADEMEKHNNSLGALMACAAGPDGGMAAMSSYNSLIYTTGEWNSKTVEDYIDMVKDELKKQNIKVDAVMEKKMIDYLVQQEMPKSSTEYILRKMAEGSIFNMEQRARTSSLQDHINKEGEKKYNPSLWEEITGSVLGWASNAAVTMGYGGFLGQTAMDVGVEGVNALSSGQQEKYLEDQRKLAVQEIETASKKKVTAPKWMFDQMKFASVNNATDNQLSTAKNWAEKQAAAYRKAIDRAVELGQRTIKAYGKQINLTQATVRVMEYENFACQIAQEQETRKVARSQEATSDIEEAKAEVPVERAQTSEASKTQETPQNTGDYSGWSTLANSMGFGGFGDTVNHLGVTLAMLPDLLLGIFTGKTKSIGMDCGSMIPLAAILCGSFIRNPALKCMMMLGGGACLLNKMGQEGLADYRKDELSEKAKYKQYADEELNPRIKDPHIEGNVLIVDIDNVPRVVTLPQSIVDGYQAGALPLNTIANRILAKTDQMEQTQQQSRQASERYEQNEQQTVTRSLGQR